MGSRNETASRNELMRRSARHTFRAAMDLQQILLVTQYHGGHFAGWQRQPVVRTVQAEMERVLLRLCGTRIAAVGAGRTDAGVHAHGQGVGVWVSERWTPSDLQRAMNALLDDDVWIRGAHLMAPTFHPRRSAIARRYRYLVGTDPSSRSPFRRPFEWAMHRTLDADALHAEAESLLGEHEFRAFAVAHTAPIDDHHRCVIQHAAWTERDGGWVFEIVANRFLHHMVRFLVGTMVDVAQGRKQRGSIARLLTLAHNADTAPPAPAHGLSLHEVVYPPDVYQISL